MSRLFTFLFLAWLLAIIIPVIGLTLTWIFVSIFRKR